jgi:hypothetical protein
MYIIWIKYKILDGLSSIPFINRLVLQFKAYSYERRKLVKSLCEGEAHRDTRSHHKAAKPLGLLAVAWSQSITSGASRSIEGSIQLFRTPELVSSCGEGYTDETIVSRNSCRGGTETRQRHSNLGSRPRTNKAE